MHDRLIQIVALIVLAGGVVGAFMLTPSLNEQRVERQLTFDSNVGDASNPAYVFGESLGAFRGIWINILWKRAEDLKQEGKFFEANNLAEMITTLQPRYPEAWNFHGWNMAYNISVKCKTPEERWDWVQKGMALIRDRGIPNNPNGVVLYRSLAWILGHKMAGGTDDMHFYYKARWAERWQTLLGEPDPRWTLRAEYTGDNQPPDDQLDPLEHGRWLATVRFADIDAMAQRYFKRPGVNAGIDDPAERDYKASNYFQALSPDAQRRFYGNHPGVEPVVRELEALRGDNGEDLGLGLNTKTLRAIGRLIMFEQAGYPVQSPAISNAETLGVDAMAIQRWLAERPASTRINVRPGLNIDAMREQLREQEPDADIIDLAPMLDLLRAQALIADYHMDPAYMLYCMQRFGPLDWRHPSAHAVYWTALGTQRAEQWTVNKDRIDFINANRATIHALQNLAHNGKVHFRPEAASLGQLGRESINQSPDTRMIPAYDRAWSETIAKVKAGEFGERHDPETYERGHENFLQAAVYLYYFQGDERRARRYFQRVRELYADSDRSPAAMAGEYELSLPDFARVRFDDDLGFQGVALIEGKIRLAWSFGLAERDTGVMQRHLASAKQTYDNFLEERQATEKYDETVQARQGLPPFEDLVLNQFLLLMNDTQYSLVDKAGIWQLSAPLLNTVSDEVPVLFVAYLRMAPLVQAQAQVEGWGNDIAAMFPQPRGYAQWYQQNVPQQAPAPVRPQ